MIKYDKDNLDVLDYMDELIDNLKPKEKKWFNDYMPLANLICEFDHKCIDNLDAKLKEVKLSKRKFNRIMNMKRGIKYEDLVKFSKLINDGELYISLRGELCNTSYHLEKDLKRISTNNKNSITKTINDILEKGINELINKKENL